MEFLDLYKDSRDTWSLRTGAHICVCTHEHAGEGDGFSQTEGFVDTKSLKYINSRIASLHADGSRKLPVRSLLSYKQ